MLYHGIDKSVDFNLKIKEIFFPDMVIDFTNKNPFHKYMGIEIVKITPEEINGKLNPNKTPDLTTGKTLLMGAEKKKILHGGAISSFIDALSATLAGSVAFLHMTLRGLDNDEISSRVRKIATANMNINYLQAAVGDEFYLIARLVRAGNKSIVINTTVTDENESVLATASSIILY